MNKSLLTNLGFFAVIIVLIVGLKMFAGRSADTPSYFDTTRTLGDAQAAAAESGKPVLAVVTADWCAPCQTFKRGALSDARVGAWITEHTEPVYIDATETNSDAYALNVSTIPTVVLLDGETEVARTGGASADAFIEWGDAALERVTRAD